MLIETEPMEQKQDKYEAARQQIMTDIFKAIDNRIPDFEIRVEGMKPGYIREKAIWYGTNHMITVKRNEAIAKAKEKGVKLGWVRVSYGELRGAITSAITKEETPRVLFHIDFDLYDGIADAAVKTAERILAERASRTPAQIVRETLTPKEDAP